MNSSEPLKSTKQLILLASGSALAITALGFPNPSLANEKYKHFINAAVLHAWALCRRDKGDTPDSIYSTGLQIASEWGVPEKMLFDEAESFGPTIAAGVLRKHLDSECRLSRITNAINAEVKSALDKQAEALKADIARKKSELDCRKFELTRARIVKSFPLDSQGIGYSTRRAVDEIMRREAPKGCKPLPLFLGDL